MSPQRQRFVRAARLGCRLLAGAQPGVAGIGLLAIVMLFTSGCGTLRVDVDRDSTILIPAGATWAWGPEPAPKQPDELDPRVNNSIIHGRVQRSVEEVLGEKGFRQTDPGRADFLVEYRVGVRDRREMVTQAIGPPPGSVYGPYGRWGPGWAWGYYGPPAVTTREIRYTEGALMIELVQRSTGKLAFRTTGTDSITREDGSDQAVLDVVRRILRDLP
jgi:Domain of unknown function (DUF4136)